MERGQFPAIAENAQAPAKVWRMREYTVEKIRTILELCVVIGIIENGAANIRTTR